MAGNASRRTEVGLKTGAFFLTVDGKPVRAMPGETLAAALYAAGIRAWRRSRQGDPRGLLCGMGVCYDCLVTVDGVPGQRACQVEVRPGMVVSTGLRGKIDG
jgi:predicted molibdopterin-dependent oxidoreductase YjgC